MFVVPTPTPDGIVGLKVKLDRPVDRERPCCRNVCASAPARGRMPANFTAPTADNIAAGSANLLPHGSNTS
jgi:hypothetical protein